MREETTRTKLEDFLRELGRRARGPGAVFITGGGTAVWEGWRPTTIDVDLKASPEPEGFFEAIAELKDEISLNVELASPADFIPELPGWRERCVFLGRFGKLDFFHYDPYSQALSKLERAHARDLDDVRNMVRRGMVAPKLLWELFERIEPALIRFPAIDPGSFREAVLALCRESGDV
jgi:hypothetical protein